MRIALISDIHGNDVALKAVVDEVERVGVDQIICLGDVATLGPCPGDVINRLRELGCPRIMGNHDAFLLDPELIHTYTEAPIIVEAVDWCRSHVSREDLEFVRTFEPRLEIPLDDQIILLCYHGSPRSHMEDLLCTTPPDELDRLLAGHEATVLAGGHTHIQMLRQHRGMLIVNPGSVGAPFREFVSGAQPTLMDHVEYALVGAHGGAVSVEVRRLPLDKPAVRKTLAASDNPLSPWLLQQYA
jgi:putative phosphoesterase